MLNPVSNEPLPNLKVVVLPPLFFLALFEKRQKSDTVGNVRGSWKVWKKKKTAESSPFYRRCALCLETATETILIPYRGLAHLLQLSTLHKRVDMPLEENGLFEVGNCSHGFLEIELL